MDRKHPIPLPDSVLAHIGPAARMLVPLAGDDLAAETATREASQVSALLASRTLSLTNLKAHAIPGLLRSG